MTAGLVPVALQHWLWPVAPGTQMCIPAPFKVALAALWLIKQVANLSGMSPGLSHVWGMVTCLGSI